jgi:hypothetical protein
MGECIQGVSEMVEKTPTLEWLNEESFEFFLSSKSRFYLIIFRTLFRI